MEHSRFALLEQRMSMASSAGAAASTDGFSAPMLQQSIGFSSSREPSNPGMATTPQGTPSKVQAAATSPTSHATAPAPPFAALASNLWKRKRDSPSDLAENNFNGGPPTVNVRTPSPSMDGHQGVVTSGSVSTHSPPKLFEPGQQQQYLQQLAEQQRKLQQAEREQQQLATELARARGVLAERDQELERTKSALAAEEEGSAAARSELEQSKIELEASTSQIAGMKAELGAIRDDQEAEARRQLKGREALREALRERCFRERAAAKERLARESVRLGTLEPDSKAFGATQGGWVQKDGTALVQLAERERALEARRAALDEDKKTMRKKRTSTGKAAGGSSTSPSAVPGGEAAAGGEAEALMELADLEESLNLRGSLLSKERAELQAERKQLEREQQDHFQELRLNAELEGIEPELRSCPSLPSEGSVYEPGAENRQTTLDLKRFVFLDLIAQGGFACVFRAYDLVRHEHVACKLHRMSEGWADARKEAFVRHVEREMEITVGVRHHRIVDTYAAFEVSSNTVVSVMPYCNGGSLAELLRKHGPLQEKDEKSIMLQMLCGLRHLHSRADPIIHYDLKPANILFHDGEVKLSDFGLSKVMKDVNSTSQPGMELTSYGSGTRLFTARML